MGNKITSKEMPICINCIHAYVCEEYNLNRDMLRKRCAYHNDHFIDIEQHEKKVSKETAEKILEDFDNHGVYSKDYTNFMRKQFGVEIKE